MGRFAVQVKLATAACKRKPGATGRGEFLTGDGQKFAVSSAD
jgi:hypothetical protein